MNHEAYCAFDYLYIRKRAYQTRYQETAFRSLSWITSTLERITE